MKRSEMKCYNCPVEVGNILTNKYVVAFLWGYIVTGVLGDIITGMIMRRVWDKTTESYEEVLDTKKNKKATDEGVPFWLNGKNRKPFNWAPRLVGIIERFLYTTAVIFNQFGLIGIWLVFKAIGDWSDFSSMNKKNKDGKDDIEEGTTRIRANNFLIGTGITLIFGILGGIVFRCAIDQNFLVEIINKSYLK